MKVSVYFFQWCMVLFIALTPSTNTPWCCKKPEGHCSYVLRMGPGIRKLVDERGATQKTYKNGLKEFCALCNHEVLSHLCDKTGDPQQVCVETEVSRVRE